MPSPRPIRLIPLAVFALLTAAACVPGGGSGGGDTDDAAPPTVDGAPPDAALPADACAPSCAERACGPDGCGGTCGACPDTQTCTGAGLCVDIPQSCGDATCDPDAETCENCPADCGQCCGDGQCTPDHGEDCARCPADCGCAAGETCDPAGVCEATCAPACADRACGPDGCGGTCGLCAEDQFCDPDGQCIARPAGCGDDTCDPDEDCTNCEADCGCTDPQICRDRACVDPPDCTDPCDTPDLAACTPDTFAYRLCTPDPDQPGCTTLTRRIPCADGRTCQPDAARGAACEGTCREPEVILLVDRSSSMAGDRWAFTHPTLIDAATRRDRTARLGLRPFPSGADGCAADATIPPAYDAADTFAAIEPPADTAQTPLAAAFDDLEAAYGDPVDGQSVILITDGDETCAAERAAVDRAAALRRRGVRTFVIGIGQQANHELLTAIARAGDTREHYPVADADTLRAALDDIFERLDTCACALNQQRCRGDRLETCIDLDGERSYQDLLNCFFGCNADAQTCYPVCDPYDPTVRCDGDTATRCAPTGDGYQPAEACPFGCQDGPGCNPTCRPDDLRCDGDESQRCAPDGDRYEPAEACEHGCRADRGTCYPTCRPGQHRCDGDTRERCDATGENYVPVGDCPHGCNPDTLDCNPLCRPGDPQCDGDTFTRCAPTGDRFDVVEECAAACTPDGCTLCAPYLDARCGPGRLERCAPDGAGFDPAGNCQCNTLTATCLPARFGAAAEGQVRFDTADNTASTGRIQIADQDGERGLIPTAIVNGRIPDITCRQIGWPAATNVASVVVNNVARWQLPFTCIGDERALLQCQTDAPIAQQNQFAVLTCLTPEIGDHRCVGNDTMSWWYQPDGIVRREFCHQGCDPATRRCRPDDGDRARCLDDWTVTALGDDGPGPWIADGDLTVDLERHAQFGSCTLRTTGGNDIYRFTAPAAGTYRFTTSGDNPDGDTVLFARAHCVADGSERACNDDIGAGNRYSQISVALGAGEALYVFVDSYTIDFRTAYRLTAERLP